MRNSIVTHSILALFISCAATAQALADQAKLQGTWKLDFEETKKLGGKSEKLIASFKSGGYLSISEIQFEFKADSTLLTKLKVKGESKFIVIPMQWNKKQEGQGKLTIEAVAPGKTDEATKSGKQRNNSRIKVSNLFGNNDASLIMTRVN